MSLNFLKQNLEVIGKLTFILCDVSILLLTAYPGHCSGFPLKTNSTYERSLGVTRIPFCWVISVFFLKSRQLYNSNCLFLLDAGHFYSAGERSKGEESKGQLDCHL